MLTLAPGSLGGGTPEMGRSGAGDQDPVVWPDLHGDRSRYRACDAGSCTGEVLMIRKAVSAGGGGVGANRPWRHLGRKAAVVVAAIVLQGAGFAAAAGANPAAP